MSRFTCDYRRGTASNYSATATPYKSQTTTAPTRPFAGCCVFISRSLATASNNGDSSASSAQVPSSKPPVQNSTEITQKSKSKSNSKSKLLYDWLFTANQFVLASIPLRPTTRLLFNRTTPAVIVLM
jgi:hypothetical protein